MLTNTAEFPSTSIHDTMQEWKGGKIEVGEYYIDRVTLPVGPTSRRRLQRDFTFSFLIQNLLDEAYITNENIKWFLKASFALKADTFKPFVEYVFERFESKQAKDLAILSSGI
jgi:hypothetical protein